jgi:hypothetical protein
MSERVRSVFGRWCQFVSVASLGFWLGGVAFDGGVAVPVAHDVLNSHREIGFVTRSVTGTANFIGVGVLAVLLVNIAVRWCRRSRAPTWGAAVSWLVMAAGQAVLFILRSRLDGMLDPAARVILDRARFMPLHERYLNVTSVVCVAALVHLWFILTPAVKAEPGDQTRS